MDEHLINLLAHCEVTHTQQNFDPEWQHNPGLRLKVRKAFAAYKKLQKGIVATLTIPKGAIVILGDSFSDDRKLRTNRAVVKSLSNGHTCGVSIREERFYYEVGEVVRPQERFALDYDSCASGIHFFMTLARAMSYN